MDVGGLKGQQVGAYRLEEKLGAGGFGAVYRATQVVRGQSFGEAAVKVLDPDKMGDLHDPLVELRLGVTSAHPNLLPSIPGGMSEAEVEDRDGERDRGT